MRNPVSYEFNPVADNALDVMSDIVQDYTDDVVWDEWKKEGGFDLRRENADTLDTVNNFEKLHGPECYYLSLHHFNDVITVVPSFAPLFDTVRSVVSNTPRQSYDDVDNVVELCVAG